MKSYILSVFIFLFAVLFVLFNSFHMHRVYDMLLEKLDAFPETVPENGALPDIVAETDAYLDRQKEYFLLTLPQGSVNDLFCDYADTVAYLRAGDALSYPASLERTRIRLRQLRKNEELPLYDLIFGPDEREKRYFP